jgi:hypothetical protein
MQDCFALAIVVARARNDKALNCQSTINPTPALPSKAGEGENKQKSAVFAPKTA